PSSGSDGSPAPDGSPVSDDGGGGAGGGGSVVVGGGGGGGVSPAQCAPPTSSPATQPPSHVLSLYAPRAHEPSLASSLQNAPSSPPFKVVQHKKCTQCAAFTAPASEHLPPYAPQSPSEYWPSEHVPMTVSFWQNDPSSAPSRFIMQYGCTQCGAPPSVEQ